MKIERMYARGAEYQRFETLKRNREKRTRQKLAFMEGVQMVEQAIRHNWEFAAMAVADGRRLSGWAEDMIAKAKPEVLYQMEEGMHADLSDREESCEIIALVRERTDGLERIEEKTSKSSMPPLYAVFDRPASPGNLGTFLRSADAFGGTGVKAGKALSMTPSEEIFAASSADKSSLGKARKKTLPAPSALGLHAILPWCDSTIFLV